MLKSLFLMVSQIIADDLPVFSMILFNGLSIAFSTISAPTNSSPSRLSSAHS
jgi:hypothetical protein